MASTVSSWRPPWLDTTIPAAPCSQASRASSAVCTPLSSTGAELSETNCSRSFQVSDASTSEKTSCGVTPSLWPTAAVTAGMSMCGGTEKPVRKSRSRRPARGASTVSASAL